MHLLYIYVWLFVFTGFNQVSEKGRILTSGGKVTFTSEAPLETISAGSNQLKGVIDTTSNSFAFTVGISTFSGFNSPLQQEHFNENYMESVSFPKASFTGKIIESINYGTISRIEVRAKGILTIHGVQRERLIRVKLDIRKEEILVSSDFIVALADHDIKIPRIVNQKISSDIQVRVQCVFKK